MRVKVRTKEIIKKAAKKMNCYYPDAAEIICVHLYNTIVQELCEGKEVNIAPLGKFYLRPAHRAQKGGKKRNLIKFKPSSNFQREIDLYKN